MRDVNVLPSCKDKALGIIMATATQVRPFSLQLWQEAVKLESAR